MMLIPYDEFIKKHRYNKSQVARLLGVSRSTVDNWGGDGVEVFVVKRGFDYIPFVSYEYLGKKQLNKGK